MKFGKEDIEQIMFFDWLSSNPIYDKLIFHVANQRQTSYQEGRKLKRMGVKKGVSDIICLIAKEPYHGLMIELKSPSGKLSKDQMLFRDAVTEQNYLYKQANSFNEAKEILVQYLNI